MCTDPADLILLVDDNVDDVDLTVRALRKSNSARRIAVARDGVEALHFLFGTGAFAARDASDLPTVVLVDLTLPGLSGLELIRRIRADRRTASVPVVIFTGSTDERARLDGLALGANGWLRKPQSMAELAETMRGLTVYWKTPNRPCAVDA